LEDQGDALAIGKDRVLAAGFRAIDGAGAGLLAPAPGADVARVGEEPGEVNLVGAAEGSQEDAVDLVPDPGGPPVGEPVPAGHPAAAAHLLGQLVPGEAGLEEEDDPGEDLAIIEEGASAFGLGGMGRDQGFDQFPEFVGEEGLGHETAPDYRRSWNGLSRYPTQMTGQLLGYCRVSKP